MNWEKKIVETFINRYFVSASDTKKEHSRLRLRSPVFFPNFETAPPDEKESFLEAAESLERKGIVKLVWEKHAVGERLKTLTCENCEKIFTEAGKPYPETEAEKIKLMLCDKVNAMKSLHIQAEGAEKIIALMEYISLHFGPREIGRGIDRRAMEDLSLLLESKLQPARLENITPRALSILLYRDSKRLEELLAICKPLLSAAKKAIPLSGINFPVRSYPETMISGKIIVELNNAGPPIVNAGGFILGFPLESAKEIISVRLVSEKKEKTVLTIENKETFYALGTAHKQKTNAALEKFDCFLYVGGYSNRAAAMIVKKLAASGFSFYHAGDLDPDGLLILQHIQEISGKPVLPLRMDTETFDKYMIWGRTLTKPMLRHIGKIRKETRDIPGMDDLLRRFEETGLGVEQEIIDYR